jgi:hypothetical protein
LSAGGVDTGQHEKCDQQRTNFAFGHRTTM